MNTLTRAGQVAVYEMRDGTYPVWCTTHLVKEMPSGMTRWLQCCVVVEVYRQYSAAQRRYASGIDMRQLRLQTWSQSLACVSMAGFPAAPFTCKPSPSPSPTPTPAPAQDARSGGRGCEDLPLPLTYVGDKKVKRFHFSEIIGRLPYVRATVTADDVF
jgi:hypothetical protein